MPVHLHSIFSEGIYSLRAVLQLLVALSVAVILVRRRDTSLSRRGAAIFGFIWTLLVTAEFWVLGSRSFVAIEGEGEVSVPLLLYKVRHDDGGLLATGFGGGLDAYAMLGSGWSWLSLERLLFAAFPPWIAIAAHKVMVAGVSYSGAYLLARRGAGAARWPAAGIAAWYTLAHQYSLSLTVAHGIGYAAIAFAIYVLVVRLGKENYLWGALLLAVIHAASCSVAHSLVALAPAVFLAWLFLGARKPGRFLGAVVLAVLITLINWADVIVALAQTAPYSYRGTEVSIHDQGADFLVGAWRFFGASTGGLLLTVVAILILAWERSPLLLRAAGLLACGMALGPLLLWLPWDRSPAPFLRGFDFTYTTLALTGLIVLTAGWAARADPRAGALRLSSTAILAASAFGLAAGQLAEWKVFHASQWLGRGGQAALVAHHNLEERDWAPDTAFRVATIPYRIFANTVAAYGLESFDSLVNVVPRELGLFFRERPGGEHLTSVHNYFVTAQDLDFACCQTYEIGRVMDLDRLRMANVGFIVSALPLTDRALTLVSGPPPGPVVPPRRDDQTIGKIRGWLSLLLGDSNLYIYKLSQPLPRAFIATATIVQRAAIAATPDIVQAALRQEAVIATDLPSGAFERAGRGSVTGTNRVRDGYDIDVDMEDQGVLILNTIWAPFWTAGTAGRDLPVARANAIQSAISVPAGRHTIRVRYLRPTAADLASRMIH